MSFQDDVAAIAVEHGPHVAVEYVAQCHDAYDVILPGLGLGDWIRRVWRDFGRSLLLAGFRVAASSGADNEADYYRERIVTNQEFEVGQWVTVVTADGREMRGKVVDKTETPDAIEYTLHQFPTVEDGPPMLYGVDWACTPEELGDKP